MSQAAVIDGLQFARDRARLDGVLELESLGRLAATGCDAATLNYVLQGGQTRDGNARIELTVDGSVRLVCQRCLDSLEWPVAIANVLELAHSVAEIETADDDIDRILVSKAMEVAAIVEDEVILALPMVPMHEHCSAPAEEHGSDRQSPFAALAGLKKERGTGGKSS